MDLLTLEEFEREADAFDAVVKATPGIDPWCSSSDWILPAQAAFAPKWIPRVFRGEHGWAAFLYHAYRNGPKMLVGFDTQWEFACPIAGVDAPPVADEVMEELARREKEWDVILLAGLVRGEPLYQVLMQRFRERYGLGRGQHVRRVQASLEGGVAGFLSRRSSKMRRELARAHRRAEAAGLTVESASGPGLLDRMVEVEKRSWKGFRGEGLMIPPMFAFYRGIVARLTPRGAVRAHFLRHRGEDVGYILGGVRDNAYRGFQFSFDERFSALSPGNLLQLAQIEALCAEGVTLYDLGVDMGYKRRWGEIALETMTVLVMRR